jgi:hypothetical protein
VEGLQTHHLNRFCSRCKYMTLDSGRASASLAQLVEHALRKRMVTGSIPVGGSFAMPPQNDCTPLQHTSSLFLLAGDRHDKTFASWSCPSISTNWAPRVGLHQSNSTSRAPAVGLHTSGSSSRAWPSLLTIKSAS